ncbi:MAG: radical SAM protein [Flexilinea sp.]
MDFWNNIPSEYHELIREQIDGLHQKNCQPVDQTCMPKPLWAVRDYDYNGDEAWERLRENYSPDAGTTPYSVYIHVPFCQSRCGYCDCYAFPLTKNRQRYVSEYTDALIREINLWGSLNWLDNRVVSTVHFGGGTPLMLGRENMIRIMEALDTNLNRTKQTELALETTSAMLDDEIMELLDQLGFSRLHIGVQSLQNDVRRLIGRHETDFEVLRKIQQAVSLGWIVSTDIIIGLPQYNASGLLDDMNRLIESGIEGFSIYELVHSPRNQRFFEQHNLLNRPPMQNYLLFQLAFQHLKKNGFRNNLYNHLSKGRDNNLYFTSPARKEDLLGIGTIADGYFGGYQYRHANYLPYIQASAAKKPGLAGGLRRTPVEGAYVRLETELRSGCPDPLIFLEILGKDEAVGLFARWVNLRWISIDLEQEKCCLLPNGSWFIGSMLSDSLSAMQSVLSEN